MKGFVTLRRRLHGREFEYAAIR